MVSSQTLYLYQCKRLLHDLRNWAANFYGQFGLLILLLNLSNSFLPVGNSARRNAVPGLSEFQQILKRLYKSGDEKTREPHYNE